MFMRSANPAALNIFARDARLLALDENNGSLARGTLAGEGDGSIDLAGEMTASMGATRLLFLYRYHE